MMKYQNLKSFEKHLESASPNHFCRVYLVVIPEDQQRGMTLQKVSSALASSLGVSVEKFSIEDSLHLLFDALLSPSLFGGETVAVLDECESLKKKEIEPLLSLVEKSLQSGYLILGARGKTPLIKAVESSGVVLDLHEEKPWDRDKRLIDFLIVTAHAQNKRIAPDAATLLLERVGKDVQLLLQELSKILCYIGDRPSVERGDVLQMSSVQDDEVPWRIAEEMVWDGKMGSCDPTNFVSFLFALRAQLQIGLKIISLQESEVPFGDWGPYFPKVWPKTLEKRRSQAFFKGKPFFEKGLQAVFKIESLSRGGSTQMEALFDLLTMTLMRK